MEIFRSFHVAPFYGTATAVLEWQLAPGVTGDVYFYRSINGVRDWILLNEDEPGGTSGTFMDEALPRDSMLDQVHYRGVVANSGPADTWLRGPVVSPYDRVERREYYFTREIMRREYIAMRSRKGAGIRAFHCIPLVKGTPSHGYDEETGQKYGYDCPDAGASDGMGTPWQGAFERPVQTWVRMISAESETEEDATDASTVKESAKVRLRLLAFPKPRCGHMIVLPDSDRRYVVDGKIDPFLVRGIIPVAWEITAIRLRRTDPRHRMVMPALLPDPPQ